jgi:hypothetical protein
MPSQAPVSPAWQGPNETFDPGLVMNWVSSVSKAWWIPMNFSFLGKGEGHMGWNSTVDITNPVAYQLVDGLL